MFPLGDDPTIRSFGPSRFFNRELSWLAFNRRVLALAEDPQLPVLERVKFVAIVSANLDEFFQVRVGALHEQLRAGVIAKSFDGRSADQQCAEIRERTLALLARQSAVLAEQIAPLLVANGIRIAAWKDLDEAAKGVAIDYFTSHVEPVLTPLSVDRAHPFPAISNLSLNLAVWLERPRELRGRLRAREGAADAPALREARRRRAAAADRRADRIPARSALPRHAHPRTSPVPRDARRRPRARRRRGRRPARSRRRGLAAPPAHQSSRAARSRRARCRRPCARCCERISSCAARTSTNSTRCTGLAALWELHDLPRPELKLPPELPVQPLALRGEEPDRAADFFEVLRREDVLVHHPYESFRGSVEAFICQAAARSARAGHQAHALPHVGPGESRGARALPARRSAGKQVVVLVELQARFDEQANIERAQLLEDAGAHVVYGVDRTEDAREDRARRAPGGRRPAPLLPHRHGQLQPDHRAASTRTSACSPPRPRSAATWPRCSTT